MNTFLVPFNLIHLDARPSPSPWQQDEVAQMAYFYFAQKWDRKKNKSVMVPSPKLLRCDKLGFLSDLPLCAELSATTAIFRSKLLLELPRSRLCSLDWLFRGSSSSLLSSAEGRELTKTPSACVRARISRPE